MFNFRQVSRKSGTDLLNSELYDEKSFYGSFVKDLKSAEKSIVIESPFLTEKRAVQFSKLFKRLYKRGIYLRVNTRDPKHHDKLLEIQAWKAIKVLRKARVKVYICSDMRHRKLAIIDNTILWDGSLNIMSQSNSKEIMRRTRSEALCKQMIQFTKLNNRFW